MGVAINSQSRVDAHTADGRTLQAVALTDSPLITNIP